MLKTLVIGHLGKDATVNTVNGKNVINFNVAHTEKWKDSQGNNQEKTTWVDCSYWTDKTAIAPYLQKGKQVFVEGVPDVRAFTRNDGTAGAALALRVMVVQLLGGGGTASGNGNGQANTNTTAASNTAAAQTSEQPPAAANANGIADDLPF